MKRKKPWGKERSLFRQMLIFLLAILLVQSLLYLCVFAGGGILDETENNAFSILMERTANRRLYLENEMVQRWGNTKEGKSDLMATVASVLEEKGRGISSLGTDPALCQEILTRSGDSLVSMLRRNGVTGAFVILNCPTAQEDYPGVYIRDYDPMHYAADNADLLLVRGLPQVARQLSIPMDSYWSAFFRFGSSIQSSKAFFYYPMEAVSTMERKERGEDYYYYWSNSFSHSPYERPVVSYTTPLVWEDGTVIGVIGVDLTVDYLSTYLNYKELGDNMSGAYFLGVSQDGGATYRAVCTSGPMFRDYFGQSEILRTEPNERENMILLSSDQSGQEKVYGAVQPIKLYNNNTPFEGEQWALIGMQTQSHLRQFSDRVYVMLQITTATALVLGLVIVYFSARLFTDPISALVEDLRRSNPTKPIRLRHINITELDALSESIETLSNAAAESAARISKIISMSHIPIGVFEHQKKMGLVFCSKSLFEILNWDGETEDTFLQEDDFLRRLFTVTCHRSTDKDGGLVYHLTCNGQERWVQLFCREENEKTLGTFLDVTADVESKRRLEYERDYDVLTGLYNRLAFDRKVGSMLKTMGQEKLQTAAVLMLDLDNLKYINDFFGHDYGDRFIQSFGHCLQYFHSYNAVVGRRSGDEFNVFLYGYRDQDEVRAILDNFWEQLGRATSSLPDGEQIRVRASGGMAWYRKDAYTYTELMRLADFAMYNVKHTVKGAVREFDRQDYDQKSILVSGQDALNRMLENRMVRYALQPIVSAVDGAVFGYEFLMRPMVPQLTNLDKLFRLARAESKLLQIEEMTWAEVMNRFSYLVRTDQLPDGTRAFINSVSNQYLSEQIFKELEVLYSDTLSRVVLEITEGEEPNRDLSRAKKAKMRSWGGLLALDDYGTGYNTEAVLVDLTPDIVKVDVSLVRKIDCDSNRLALVQNLMTYAKVRGIKVLAEGVETITEMETLISCGVDYLQGYYICKPQLDVPRVSPAVVKEICTLHEQYFL